MEAEGPVTITSKDQVGQGDSAVYDKGENKLYLIGNVSLAQRSNTIRGSKDARLVYDLASGHAQIVGGLSSQITPGSDDPAKKKPEPKPAPQPKK